MERQEEGEMKTEEVMVGKGKMKRRE
jgi:hypothetical protein